MNQHSTAASTQRFFSAPLAETDPELAAAIRSELAPPAGRHRTDRVGEHRLRRRAGSAGLGADQQIRRGLSRPPLLRRLRLCRRGGEPGDRPRQAAVRLRLRQRAAALRRAGQPGGVPGAAAARRHHPGHEPRRRRPPDPRRRAQPVRQVVPRGAVRRAQGRRHPGLRGTGTPRPDRKAEADHRRRLGLSALHRFPAHPQGGGRGRRLFHGRHGAFRRPGRGRSCSPARCRTPMSSPPRRTRPCAARAAAWS